MKKVSDKSPTEQRATSGPAPRGRKARPPRGSGPPRDPDEIAPEYDFRGARPNPYAAQYATGATAVVLDPDVAAAFPTAAAVNDVLRTVAGLIRQHPPAAPAAAKRGRARRSA